MKQATHLSVSQTVESPAPRLMSGTTWVLIVVAIVALAVVVLSINSVTSDNASARTASLVTSEKIRSELDTAVSKKLTLESIMNQKATEFTKLNELPSAAPSKTEHSFRFFFPGGTYDKVIDVDIRVNEKDIITSYTTKQSDQSRMLSF